MFIPGRLPIRIATALIVILSLQSLCVRLSAQTFQYQRTQWTPAESKAGIRVDDYGNDERLPLPEIPKEGQNKALARGYVGDSPLGFLKDREQNAWLNFTMRPDHGSPLGVSLDIERPSIPSDKLYDNLGGLALVNNPYLAIVGLSKDKVVVNGGGDGDPNKINLKLPAFLVQQIFDADVVRVITKLGDGSNLVMTFDTKAFHEGEFYTYASNPLEQADLDQPLWKAPLDLRFGESKEAVWSYLKKKDSSFKWNCWTAKENQRITACGRWALPEYQFYMDRLFANGGECQYAQMTCSALLDRLLPMYDSSRKFSNMREALNTSQRLTSVRNGNRVFSFGWNHDDIQWCKLDLAYAPPYTSATYCLR